MGHYPFKVLELWEMGCGVASALNCPDNTIFKSVTKTGKNISSPKYTRVCAPRHRRLNTLLENLPTSHPGYIPKNLDPKLK